jgi:ATP phosphoribosyltransferase
MTGDLAQGVSVSIAVCTGVLLEGSLELLAEAGITKIDRGQLGRRLLLERDGVRVVLVRPADVAAYVDFGSVDLGVVGKDQLWENPGSHYELVDLGFGGCRLVMAVPEGSALDGPETWPPVLRVATKYPRATAAFFASKGRGADIVGLHGSVELAPQVGLADAVVDLTATGATLRENRLRVIAEVGSSTARLIANQASLKTRSGEVQSLVTRLAQAARR